MGYNSKEHSILPCCADSWNISAILESATEATELSELGLESLALTQAALRSVSRIDTDTEDLGTEHQGEEEEGGISS